MIISYLMTQIIYHHKIFFIIDLKFFFLPMAKFFKSLSCSLKLSKSKTHGKAKTFQGRYSLKMWTNLIAADIWGYDKNHLFLSLVWVEKIKNYFTLKFMIAQHHGRGM